METRRWINQSLPQTLLNATILLYIRAAFGFLFGTFFVLYGPLIGLLLVAGHVGAGYLISNERTVGYQLGIGMAFAPMAFRLLAFGPGGLLSRDIIGLVFEILLIALLLHQQSREHARIWFN